MKSEKFDMANHVFGGQQIVLSILLGTVGGVGGTILSYRLNLPCGPAIVLTSIALFIGTFVAGCQRGIGGRRPRPVS